MREDGQSNGITDRVCKQQERAEHIAFKLAPFFLEMGFQGWGHSKKHPLLIPCDVQKVQPQLKRITLDGPFFPLAGSLCYAWQPSPFEGLG